MSPSEQLDAVLGHPLVLIAAAVLAGRLVAGAVRAQAARLRLGAALGESFAWEELFAALAGWATLALGLLGLATSRGWTYLALPLGEVLGAIVRLLLGAALLAAAVRLADILAPAGEGATPAQAAEARRPVVLTGAFLAGAAVIGLSTGGALLLALLVVPAVVVLRRPAHRARAAAWLEDLTAGLLLRGQLAPGARAGDAVVPGPLGWLSTWVEVEGARRLERNAALLARVSAPAPPAT